MDIFEVLATAKAKNASDLHLSAGSPPLVRVNGELMQMTEFALPTPEDLKFDVHGDYHHGGDRKVPKGP